jgi:sugar phosphate isomerase/epimerase
MPALRVGFLCTNQSRLDVAQRLTRFAERYKIKPTWHPHAMVNDPNEVATPESMEKLLAMSGLFAINPDIGHFTAGHNDAVDFLKMHHDRITHIHIKDRKRNGGPNVALGTGDSPIKECLTLIRDGKWPIHGIIEREYRDAPGNVVEQTRAQME